MKKALVIATMLMINLNTNAQLFKTSLSTNETSSADNSGCSVALSSDGTIVAVGADLNDGNGSNAGHVRVYEYVSGSWIQIGEDIDGEAANDWSGCSISLNSDGAIVAIGASCNGENGAIAGHVRIYENISGIWTQIGSDIDGEMSGDHSGRSISLSSSGDIVAIGADGNDGNGLWSGHARVYQNISGTWTQIGQDIDGEAAGDRSGMSISLSSNNSVIAIGAFKNDGYSSETGHVRVYQYISGTWQQIGLDIDGEFANDWSGYSVSLSFDGSVLAIGSERNDGNGNSSGHVRIYEYNAGSWQQIGNDIDGEAANDYSGSSVSLSSDGTIVAIGAKYNYRMRGHVRVYENILGVWTQIGQDIEGEADGDLSGWSIDLNSDGNIIAIGAVFNDNFFGVDAGHVRVYKYTSGVWNKVGYDIDGESGRNSPGFSIDIYIYPNPSSGMFSIKSERMSGVEIFDVTGKLVHKEAVDSEIIKVNFSEFSRGVYFVRVTAYYGVGIRKVVLK